MVAGIYDIHNTITNKYYIGCSANIQQRWKQHIKLLINKKHHSLKLQKAFDTYGLDSFKFLVIEKVENFNIIEEVERKYIKEYDSCLNGYNSVVKGIKLKDYEEGSIRNLSNGKYINKKEYNPNNRTKISRKHLGVNISTNRYKKLEKLAAIQEKNLRWIIEDLIDTLPDPDSLS